LHGIPLGLKDLYDLQGVATTAGAQFFRENIAAGDAAVVERLRLAGAIFLGKHNMHEIALGVTNVNPHFGASHNPWNPEMITGGSSGGSAAALSAGMCMGAMGSDTGGSVRIPAALCGIVGFKPTYGRVSLRGVMPLSWNLDHSGPMAREVLDAAMLFQAIAGHDPQYAYSANIASGDYLTGIEDGVQDWRVGLASGRFYERTEAEVQALVEAAAELFAALGAVVERVEPPLAYETARANGLVVNSDAAAFHKARLQEHPEGFGADVRQRLEAGAATGATDYSLARHIQRQARWEYERFFQEWDALLTPTTPVAAPPIEAPDAVEQALLLTRYTATFNGAGLPAISVPCGFTPAGLPAGLQIVCAPWAEAKVFQAALAYERAAGWTARRPVVAAKGSGE
jgi:aspartyl-tRNA(Asn)/glutamyl-tRNA(Gln) amidotransferase subunit A